MESEKHNPKEYTGKTDVKLDSTITDFFEILAKTARCRIGVRFIMLVFSFLGISWILLGISDRIWETTIIWRSVIFFSGLLCALWMFFNLICHVFLYTKKRPWLAKCVRNIYRAKGERLLGIIEIAEEKKDANHSFSKQIFEAAQQKMAQEINSLKVSEVFPWKKVRGPTTSACAIFLIILSVCISYPELSQNTFKRWVLPFSSIERTTLTEILEHETKNFTVLKNESHAIRFSLSPDSHRKPNFAELIQSNDSSFHLISKLNGGIYEFKIPPQKKDFSVELIVGDYQKELSVETVNRPRLTGLTSIVKFPEYLSIIPQKLDSLDNQIEVPETSKITISGRANRELSQIQISDSASHIGIDLGSSLFEFNLPKITENKNYLLHFVDSYGFSPREPAGISIKTQKDLPPSVKLDPTIDISPILLFETRMVSFSNKDDFGLNECSLLLSVFRDQRKIQDLEIIKEKFSERRKENFELLFPFDPSLFSFEDGDEVTFVASALDDYPGREPTLSAPLKYRIIGPEKHAEMIRSRMNSVIAEISEIARNQEGIQFETLSTEEKTRKSAEQQLNQKETAEINNLKNDQKNLAKRLNTTARNGSDIINEATKNPFFTPEILQEFASSLSEIKETSTGSMRKSENKLNDAASSNASDASQSMMQSAESQEKALEELRKVLAKFSEQLDRLEARTLAQRLTKLEKTEKKLSIKLVSIMPTSVGKMPSQLNNKNLSSFYEMEKSQKQVSEDADEVKNEISRYHERTQKSEYGKVSRLMEAANLKKGLIGVAQNIRNNTSFQALDNLNYWESSFEKWAKILQQESPGGDSPGGQGKGKDRTADILALLKMKKVQSDILFKTKTLDRNSFRGNKRTWSSSLNEQQNTLMIDLTDTQISVAEEALNPLFDDAHMAMAKSSEQLSKQIFNEQTQSSQQESKDILSDLINLMTEGQGQGKGRKDDKSLKAMELLMMQMGNEQSGQAKGKSSVPGKTGGGSSKGGNTDKTVDSLSGTSSTPNKLDNSSQSSGSGSPSIAPEFQEAMEKYYKAIED